MPSGVILPISAEISPRSKRPRGLQGWCVDPGVQAVMNAGWQWKEDARKNLQRYSSEGPKTAVKNLKEVRKAAVLSFFWAKIRKL